MGMDPVSLAMIAGTIGMGVYSATNKPKPPKVSPPPTPVQGETDTTPKVKKYRPAAQMFKDEDLRLGGMGKLGL